MAVLSRSLSLSTADSGEIMAVIAENIQSPQPPFDLYHTIGKDPYIHVQRDTRNQENEVPVGYGAGCRVIFLTKTCEGKPTGSFTPVIALREGSESFSNPMSGALIEGAVDPVIALDEVTGNYHLYYWINAWSPPAIKSELASEGTPPLFKETDIPLTYIKDLGYDYDTKATRQPPEKNYTCVRDLPTWPKDGTEPNGFLKIGDEGEKLGEFDIRRFWVAPHSDAHFYRFPNDWEVKAPPQAYDPVPIPGPPAPPPLVAPSDTYLIDKYPYLNRPDTKTTQAVLNAFAAIRSGVTLKPTAHRATLFEYERALLRLSNLSRTTRVLMYARGKMVPLAKQDYPDVAIMPGGTPKGTRPPVEPAEAYLIVDQPTPVLQIRNTTNKLLCTRQKWTSFLESGHIFITAPLNYQYPGAGSGTLVMSNPQVDYLIHDNFDNFDNIMRAGIAPVS